MLAYLCTLLAPQGHVLAKGEMRCPAILVACPPQKSHQPDMDVSPSSGLQNYVHLKARVQSLRVKSPLKQHSTDCKPSIQYIGKARFKVSCDTPTSLEVLIALSLS